MTEVVPNGKPQAIPSMVQAQRQQSYGGFVDAVMDKTFVAPCWIALLHVVPTTTYGRIPQFLTFLCLILAETTSGAIRFKAYFTASGMPAPPVQGLDFSTSAVTADHVGKAKQTFQMVGTALYILPPTRYVGFLLLFLAVPLAYESVSRKIQKRVLYVAYQGPSEALDYETLQFWMQARALGSALMVGIPGDAAKSLVAACAAVDQVMVHAPAVVDAAFLQAHGVDFCLVPSGQPTKHVAHELMRTDQCLQLGKDGIVRPLLDGGESKED